MLETLYWEKYPLAFFGNVFGTGFHKCHCGLTHNGFEKNKGLSCGYKKQTVFKIQLIEKLKKYCLLRLFTALLDLILHHLVGWRYIYSPQLIVAIECAQNFIPWVVYRSYFSPKWLFINVVQLGASLELDSSVTILLTGWQTPLRLDSAYTAIYFLALHKLQTIQRTNLS